MLLLKKVFSGNPAAVVPLEKWLEDNMMQQIALENNLSETAFYVKEDDHYLIRWFTPTAEVDLCGHATLATAHILFNHEHFEGQSIQFYSPKSGALEVSIIGEKLSLNFPADEIRPVALGEELKRGFGTVPLAALKGKSDYILIFKNEEEIQNLQFDISSIAKINARGIIVTAKGNQVDFVSRFFCPQVGINEDPVTGSAHTTLTPYWSKELGKNKLTAVQLSSRKGFLECEMAGDRVMISGKAITYLIGEIRI